MTTVREIMQEDVLTVRPETSVRELTRLLSENGISGVPVVDQGGHVLGVVSATDIVRLAAEEADVHLTDARWLAPVTPAVAEGSGGAEGAGETEPDGLADYFLPEDNPLVEWNWETQMGEAAFNEFKVEDIMTPVSFSIAPEASVKELADFLVRGRIHRAVVTERDHLLGIVTTMDVLRAVARDG